MEPPPPPPPPRIEGGVEALHVPAGVGPGAIDRVIGRAHGVRGGEPKAPFGHARDRAAPREHGLAERGGRGRAGQDAALTDDGDRLELHEAAPACAAVRTGGSPGRRIVSTAAQRGDGPPGGVREHHLAHGARGVHLAPRTHAADGPSGRPRSTKLELRDRHRQRRAAEDVARPQRRELERAVERGGIDAPGLGNPARSRVRR